MSGCSSSSSSSTSSPLSSSKSLSLREDNVGKRFLCVSGVHKIKVNRYTEWPWRAGVIRCSSHLDSSDKELQFLVEFDDQPWESREWINVYSDNYHIFLVESLLSLGTRPSTTRGSLHPVLAFAPLVDNIGFFKSKHSRPVEFLLDSLLDFQDTSKLKAIRDWDPSISGLDTSSANERAVRAWSELQDGQHLLINTPSVLIGFRIKVYRAEGTTQWYTAVTTGYNDDTGEFTLIDDTVLEEHYEDPRLTHMKLLGEGVVESILKGENIGITPRRSRSSVGSLRVSTHTNYGAHLPRRRAVSKKPRTNSKNSNPSVKKSSPSRKGRRKRRHSLSNLKQHDPSPKKSKLQTNQDKPLRTKRVVEKTPPSAAEANPRNTSTAATLSSLVTSDKNGDGRDGKGGCSSSTKRKAVAIVRPQPQQSSSSTPSPSASTKNVERNSLKKESEEEDLKARFSLYDFHSDDSDTEESHSQKRPLKFIKGKSKQKIKYSNNNKYHVSKHSHFISNKEEIKKGEKVVQRREKSSPASRTLDIKEEAEEPSSSKSSEEETPDQKRVVVGGEVKEEEPRLIPEKEDDDILCRIASKSTSSSSPIVDEVGLVKMDDERSDSGISTILRSDCTRSSSDERSGSRSSALSGDETRSQRPSPHDLSVIGEKEETSKCLHNNSSLNRMGDHSSADRPPSTSGDRRLLPPNNQLSASAAAANLTALTAHYQAAALQQAGLAAHGAGALSPHLLAQYHQSLAAAGIPPDILLKQPYHQFNMAAAAAAAAAASSGGVPPHLLGRNDYSMLARERELAADRERIFRERAEAEQRERERLEKERKEKERLERERREREERERRERRNAEQDFLKKQQALEAVDQHFQLSMELAKKKMADAGQHWSQLPGINKDDRRKYEDSRHDAAAVAFRQQQQYINAMEANISNSRAPTDASKGFPPFSKDVLSKEPVVFKPYETSAARYHPSNSVSPVGGHSTPSPLMTAVSPPSTPFFPNNGPPPSHTPGSVYPPPPRTASSSPPRIPPPPAHGSQARPSNSSCQFDELPLDLGSGTKRQSDSSDIPPKKAGRFDAGTLYKVSEPSVLPPEPVPSVINTVINKAIASGSESSGCNNSAQSNDNGSLNLVTTTATTSVSSSSTLTSSTTAVPNSGGGPSNQSSTTQDTNSGDEDFGYVHKLKKAWIKAYSEPNTAPPTPSHPPVKSSFSNPPTPNPRGTPSPALSTNSSKGGGGNNSSGGSVGNAKPINGHSSPKKKADSSSSDSESSHEVVKRRNTAKKGPGKGRGRSSLKANGNKKFKQQQAQDSDSNSESDKDSVDEKPKKRGRKPGLKKSDSLEAGGRKGGSETSSPSSLSRGVSLDKKPSIAQLKKTGESFLQDASCFEVAPKLAKCRECRWTQSQRNKKMPNIFCRFYAFRRLKFTKNGQLAVSGFCNPMRDASENDIAVWSVSGSKSKIDKEQAIKVLKHLKADFMTIMDQERAAHNAHMASDDTVAWKRVVQGVREMCDVCDATLFNFHWACSKCGFVVCVDCYLARKDDVVRSWGENDKERDKYSWLLCTNRQGHELEKLVLTQIVAGEALGKVESCLSNSSAAKNGTDNKMDSDGIDDKENNEPPTPELKHFLRRGPHLPKRSIPHHWKSMNALQNETLSSDESSRIYNWLCEGRVLCLNNDVQDESLDMFKRVWGSGNPIVIRNSEKLSSISSSWEPQKLIDSFGDVKVELVEAFTDRPKGIYPIKKFLSGFLDPEKCIKDESGTNIYLKTKDWPPQGEEFAEAFPSRCNEFLNSLPLPAFTDRFSPFNLASSLPDVFVRPDLGPRAWFVHGTPSNPHLGTINLHMDISDSLNVVVYSSETTKIEGDKKDLFSEFESSPSSEVVAMWHVFHPQDADKIRDLLNKEDGGKDLSFDHLHEETKYLDSNLRAKLKSEYGVSPITLFQSAGEAILIPAGAPKQVKHLKCCISLSSDFVSAESLPHSFYMVQSMRYLSESQTMGEDKLQVKNLIFHSVKDALKALNEEKS